MTKFFLSVFLKYIIIKHEKKRAWGTINRFRYVNDDPEPWSSTFLRLWPFRQFLTPNNNKIFAATSSIVICYCCESQCNYQCLLMVLGDPCERGV